MMCEQSGARKNVLIVDDDGLVRDLLEDVLSDAGYRPIAAEDGLEALDWLSRVPVHLIIVDILMPRLDGPALIKRVRRRKAWAAIPMLVLSAYANLPRHQRLAVDATRAKPFDLADLLETVKSLVDSGSPASER